MGSIQVFNHGSQEQRFLTSHLAVGFTIAVWILSLASPALVALLFYFGHPLLGAALAVFILSCYMPVPELPLVRSLIYSGVISYFTSCSVTYEAPLPSEKTLLAIHPHGFVCLGWAFLFFAPDLTHFTFCYSSALYWSPFMHLLVKLTRGRSGCAPADKASFVRLMKTGRPLALIPGGFEEATISSPAADRIFLKHRKGFAKYAFQHGYSLVPMYAFGENRLFANMQGGWKLRHMLNSKFGLPAILPWGLWWCPFLPRSRESVHVVVGTAISPTPDEDVDGFHARYLRHVEALYDRYKGQYGASPSLEVW
jgi:1-acyl-sn-glycerol-3-phosphate acyltransferase